MPNNADLRVVAVVLVTMYMVFHVTDVRRLITNSF